MSERILRCGGLLFCIVLVACVSSCNRAPEPGTVKDEALLNGRNADSLPAADEDYFHDMDRGQQLDANEIKGRNNWVIWSGGNDRFWDYLANNSFGAMDLLKTISSSPGLPSNRSNRFQKLGLINEPCFEQAAGPDPKYGLWLDRRKTNCPSDPFENEAKYPGIKFGARGKNMPLGTYYGMASGVVGLRLFPNPAFDEAAQKKWDPKRYYNDPSYYNDKDLVRPFRVGMSCGFCHIGPNPINPPADPANPEWANLSSNPGAQYFWSDGIMFWQGDTAKQNFVWQLLHAYLPGSLDTSFVSSDNIVNPRTMNAVYNVMPRLNAAKPWKEELTGGGLLNKQFQDFDRTKVLSAWFIPPSTVFTPRVLKDGSDSVGVLGALNRVYINIGLFSEEWVLHFQPLVGGKKYSPIKIEDLNKNSSYWNATQQQTPDVALFFLATAKPDHLADAPGGKDYLKADAATLNRGKVAFAENCARCHSSKQPPNLCVLGTECKPGDILENTAAYFDWMRTEVQKSDFLDGNYLSTERRVPVTELGTNACSPLATNAIRDNIWDNFSSETYKTLPPVGSITVYNPIDGTPWTYNLPAGGRGYTRPPSLISVWSSAPFLLNNSVGKFNGDPSVKGRMDAFNDAIHKMLWPETRDKDPLIGDKIPGPSLIQRTTETSYLYVDVGYLPDALKPLMGFFDRQLEIGPIPKGTPIGLLGNLDVTPSGDLQADAQKGVKLLAMLKTLIPKLKEVKGKSDEEAAAIFKDGNLVSQMLAVSKCPDFVINKGHYFGTNLADNDKQALIEFLKTF
ncbi:MAG TPA: hypothetical protein VIY49_03455 [Bryobacteraceae bacterium]